MWLPFVPAMYCTWKFYRKYLKHFKTFFITFKDLLVQLVIFIKIYFLFVRRKISHHFQVCISCCDESYCNEGIPWTPVQAVYIKSDADSIFKASIYKLFVLVTVVVLVLDGWRKSWCWKTLLIFSFENIVSNFYPRFSNFYMCALS